MADPTPPRSGLALITDEILAGKAKSRELERSSGTQRARAVERLQETVDTLADTVSTLAAQVSFLQSQVSGGTNSANWSYSGNPGNANPVWQSYSGTYDIELSVESSDSGTLVITVGGKLLSLDSGAVLGFEVTWSGGSISPDFSRAASAIGLGGGGVYITASLTVQVSVPANTICTVRSRRAVYGTVSGQANVAGQSLVVSKQW